MAIIDSYTTGMGAIAYLAWGTWWNAQVFKASADYNIASVILSLYRVGLPGTLTVSIKAVDGAGKPTGVDLCSGTIDANTVTTDTGFAEYQITFGSPAALTSGTEYCYIMTCSNVSGYSLYYESDGTGNYADGTMVHSTNEGSSWIVYANVDNYFKTTDGNAPSKPTNPTPTDTDTGVDFSGLVLDWDDGGGADTFDVYMGPTGALVKVADAITPSTYTVDLNDVPTNQVIYWRIDATNVDGTTNGDTWSFDARPVKSNTPSPTDAVSDITLDETPLGWVDGGNADTYNVYFGESGSEVLAASLQAGIEWVITFGLLDYNITYGWRINSVNDFGTTTGDTWTFDTITFNTILPGTPGGSGGGGGGGGSGEESSPTGENNMITLRRLVAAANSKIWYEDI